MKTFCKLASGEAIHRITGPISKKFRWLFLMIPLILVLASCGKEEKVKSEPQTNYIVEKRTGDCTENAFLDWQTFCSLSPITTKTRVITNVPGYPPTCSFTVQYDIKKCVLPIVFEIHVLIGNFKIIAINCPQYHTDIYDITYNPGIGIPTLSNYLNSLFDNLARIVEDLEFMETLASTNLDCAQSIGFFIYTTSYIEQSCYTFCVPKLQRPSEFDPPLKLSCGEECCKTEVYMCFDNTNSKIVKSIVKTPLYEGDPNCTPLPNLANICENYSECEVSCE